MKKYKYNNDIYSMYEEETNKNKLLIDENASLKLEIYVLKTNLKNSKNKLCKVAEQATKPYIEKNIKLQKDLSAAYEEIDRLKTQINNKTEDNNTYVLDKLTNQLNKNSSNLSMELIIKTVLFTPVDIVSKQNKIYQKRSGKWHYIGFF